MKHATQIRRDTSHTHSHGCRVDHTAIRLVLASVYFMCMRNTSLGISLSLDSARDQSMVNVDCKFQHNHRVFLLRRAVTDISKRDLGSKGGSRTVSSCRLRSKGRTLTFRSCHVYVRQGCCVLYSIRACTLVCGTSTYGRQVKNSFRFQAKKIDCTWCSSYHIIRKSSLERIHLNITRKL